MNIFLTAVLKVSKVNIAPYERAEVYLNKHIVGQS